jgi:flagellum-specific peptidoglycan hydrolase FlgJ
MNRLLQFNPEPFVPELEFGAWLGGRDFESGQVTMPCGCRHAAAAGKLSAFEIDREFGHASAANPGTPSPQPSFDSRAFRRRAVQVANQELVRWGDGRIRETDPRLRKTLQGYWKTGVGRSVSEQQLGDRAFQNSNPWSAAFISWLMKTAGAGNAFKYSGYHSAYTRAAIDNRLANNSNPFKAYRITEIAPQVGDLVCASRAGSGATYDNVRPPMQTHCDIVTGVQPGRIAIVGGNVSDSVKQRPLKTDAGGRIVTPGYFSVIRVEGGQPPVPVAPSPTPRLLRRESIPPGATLYVEIDLKITDKAGIVAPPVTGVFIPEGYQLGAAIDLVLYLHGFKADAIKRDAIDQYWNSRRFPYGAFREGVNATGRNVVLVAPTLGSRSEAGSLLKAGGLDAFLSQVLAALRAYGPQSSAGGAPALGELIFSCHSGGGWPMRQMAGGQDRALAQLRECWGFDCTYNSGDDTFWAGWARVRPKAKVYVYYIAGSQTAPLAESLRNMRVSNAIVQTSRDRRHNYVPITHWEERLQGATFLGTRSGGVPQPVPAPPRPTQYAPSSTRLKFERAAASSDWREAFLNLNGLNMFEMLRALDGLSRDRRKILMDQRQTYRDIVNMPRIEYAATVVETGRLPSSAPGDLAATGQVQTAAEFLKGRGSRRPTVGLMTQKQFIEFVGPLAQRAMATTGVPASVTIAQAIVESGWGKHTIGSAKNLFGIKGRGPLGSVRASTKEFVKGRYVTVEADFAKYESFEQSVAEHARFFLRNRRYAGAIQVRNDPDAFARKIAKAGYATAPNYAAALIKAMRDYNLYRFDQATKR